MANERFWLTFSEEPNTKYYIDEPVNFTEADFNLDRKENGHGLDVSLNGNEVQFKFVDYRTHYLEKILFYNHFYGFEADILLNIEFETGDIFVGELDFATSSTDEITYFECKALIKSSLQIVKRRLETKVDLYSNKDVDGNFIEPLVPVNMLLQAKPIMQSSTWEQTVAFDKNIQAFGVDSNATVYFQLNPAQNLLTFGIEDSYTFYNVYEQLPFKVPDSVFKVFLARNNYRNVKVSLTDILIHFYVDTDNGGNGYVDFSLNIYKGLTYSNATKTTLLSVNKNDGQSYDFSGSFENVNIGDVLRDESVWIEFNGKVRQSTNVVIGGTPRLEMKLQVSGMKMAITAEGTNYNSIVPCFRLIDVMRHVTKSISGLDIIAPRYDNGGEFYDTVLTNGNALRNVLGKPFYVSLEDIEKSIKPEHNADSEISLYGKVFFGIEKDFFTNDECGFFDNTQFSGMKKTGNPMYQINQFKFKYNKYQSQKEGLEINSNDTIHGESIWTPFNKRVENSKECAVEWTRDPFLIDTQRTIGLKVSEDTASQEDDTLFAIDSIETVGDKTFQESTILQHTFAGSYLSVKTDGSVNFDVLGIKVDTLFKILPSDLNAGDYNVQSVSNTELQLVRLSAGAISSNNDGLRSTRYIYEIKQASIPLSNRTNEGFTAITNLSSPDKYSNLRYSVKRNILNYWNSFLATVNLYHKDKSIQNSYYKNNGLCSTTYNGLTVVENEAFIPSDPIMTPNLYEDMVFVNVEYGEFLALQTALRTNHGYIRTINNENRVIKVYPVQMSYTVALGGELIIKKGYEKFEKAYMTIVKKNGFILINDETRLRKLIYTVEEGDKIVLFDLERQRLYNGVVWDKISINGALSATLNELKKLLDLL